VKAGSIELAQTAAAPAASRAGYARYVLGTLMCVYMIHHLDRMTIALLLEPIGKEFRLSDAQRGLLAGFAYAIPFALAGLPLGMLIDRVPRVRLLAVLLATWSALTALCALATSFWWLALARIGVGVAESGGTPANVAILSDYFPPERRARALGLYYMAPHLGTVVGFALAGTVATLFGWRAAFLLVGLPGLALVLLLVTTIREPSRGATTTASERAATTHLPADAAPSFAEFVRILVHTPSALHMLLGGTLSSMVTAGLATWLPPFMIRLHGFSVQQAGIAIAFGMAPLGALGAALGGTLADRLGGSRSPRVARMLATAVAVSTGAAVIGLNTASAALLIGCFALQLAAYVTTIGPSYAAVVGLMPVRTRGLSAALMQVSANVLGFGVGATLLGKLSDLLRPEYGLESLRYTMLGFSLLGLWAVAHFLAAARALRRASAGTVEPAA
jgi:MFS family permease